MNSIVMTTNNWVTFVRTWATEKGVTYGNAMKDPELKVAYNAVKPPKEKKLKAVVSEAAVVEPVVVEAVVEPVVVEAVVEPVLAEAKSEAPVVVEAPPKKKRVRKIKEVVAELIAEVIVEPILEQIVVEPVVEPAVVEPAVEPKKPRKKSPSKRVLVP